MKLLVATRNAGKLTEFRALLEGAPIRLASPDELHLERRREEDRLEREPTFAGNALRKARYFHDRSGLPTLADDSGLRVDALDGEPGVRSRRYAPGALQSELGPDSANNAYLLRRLETVPDEQRTAHFFCAVAVVLDDAARVFTGRVDGVILREARGGGGFGYDPLFHIPDLDRTLAELEPEEKNRLSHRGRAVAAARDWLHELAARETSRHPTR